MIMEILEKEPRLVPGQEIDKVWYLAMLEYFKKSMRHGDPFGFHVMFAVS
jgi:hypothetical protein